MEVPKPHSVYNGAQRGAAVEASDKALDVAPNVASAVGRHSVYNGAQRCGAVASDIEVVPDTEDEASIHAQGSTIADIHAMSDDMDLDFEDEVSGQPIQVNVVAHSCDAVKGKDANEYALVSNDDACAREQWYDPMRKSETSDAMYQRRIHCLLYTSPSPRD